MGRPVTINGRELNISDAPFIEANAEYSVTVDDDGTVMVERTDLKAENAKLREMAVQALQIIKHVGVFMAIDYARYTAFMSMARKLGIEVE